MVTQWGMSERIGMVRVAKGEASHDPTVEQEVRRIIEEAYGRAKRIIEENKAALDALTDALLERETLDGDDVRRIVEEASHLPQVA